MKLFTRSKQMFIIMLCTAGATVNFKSNAMDSVEFGLLTGDLNWVRKSLDSYLKDDNNSINDKTIFYPGLDSPVAIKGGSTFIAVVVALGYPEIVDYLLKMGANKTEDLYYRGLLTSLIDLALWFNRPEVIPVLIKHSVPGINKFRAFAEAMYVSYPALKQMSKQSIDKATNANPLLLSILFQKQDMLRALLRANALVKDDGTKTKHKFNALYYATEFNSPEAAEILVNTGKFSDKEVEQAKKIAKEKGKEYKGVFAKLAAYSETKRALEKGTVKAITEGSIPPELVKEIIKFSPEKPTEPKE